MRRIDKKGFILTETLVVSVILLVSFVFVFTQFITIFASYKQFETYNSIDGIYAATNMEKFIAEDDFESLINTLNSNKNNGIPYYEFTKCSLDIFDFYNYCITLIDEQKIKRAIITDYDLSELIQFDNYNNDFSYQLKKYIEYLDRSGNTSIIGEYRIILEMQNGTFANKIINAQIAYPTKNQYRYLRGHINLNGVDQFVTINKPIPSVTTIEMWAFTNNMINKMLWGINTSGVNHLNIYFAGNKINLNTGDGVNNYYSDSSYPTLNTWHHYAVTFDGSTSKLYIDGQYIGTSQEYRNPTGDSFKLGIWTREVGNYYWDGNIKEVKVWNKALTQTEIIKSMHNADNINESDNLLYYYKLSEGKGTTLYDYSDNNHTLNNVLNNVTWQFDDNYSDWIDGIPNTNMYPFVYTRTIYFYKNQWLDENSINNNLVLHYKFDDFQESARNLAPIDKVYTTWNEIAPGALTATTYNEIPCYKLGAYGTLHSYSTEHQNLFPFINFKPNTVYTVSWEGICDDYNNLNCLYLIFRYSDATSSPGAILPKLSAGGTWSRVSRTSDPTKIVIGVRATYGSSYSVGYMNNIQIEEKSYLSPYTNDVRLGSVKDFSLNNIRGKLEPSTSPKWIEEDGTHNGIYSFNNHYINIGRNKLNPYLKGASAITVSAWIKLTSNLTHEGYIFYETIDSDYLSNRLMINSNHTISHGGRSSGSESLSSINSNKTLDLNKWYLVTGVLDFANSKILIYINDELDSEETANFSMPVYTPGTPAIDSLIGNHPTANRNFNGLIDDIRVYNRELTLEEIKYIYDNEK